MMMLKILIFFFVAAQSLCHADDLSISMLRTPEPIKYRMESSMAGGFLWMVSAARNSSMSERLSDVLVRSNLRLNEELGGQVSAILKTNGIAVTPVLAAINPVKPWDVKYSKIGQGEPILHIYLEKVGIQSRPESSTYRPFAHVVYCLYLPAKTDDCAYGDRAYYGEGYKIEDYLVYPADEAYQWADQDDAMRRIDNVAEALHKAIAKMAQGIAAAIVANIEEAKISSK
ncbi:MAG: hypothetical protein WBK19_10400 [Azonexus sp.]